MTTAPGVEHHVVSAILRHGGRALLCHRRPDRLWYPDCWDLPGGHLHPGERAGDALVRELREELGIEIAVATAPFAHVQGADFRNDIWLLDNWSGEPTNLAPQEHDAVGWFDLAEIGTVDLADHRLAALLAAALG